MKLKLSPLQPPMDIPGAFCRSAVLAGLLCLTTHAAPSLSFLPEPPRWPLWEDLDQDGLRDADELLLNMNPLDPADGLADEDGDDLSFAWEVYLGTNSYLADSDGDGWSDSEEYLLFNTNPLDAASFPKTGTRYTAPNAHLGHSASRQLPPTAVAPPPGTSVPAIDNGDFSANDFAETDWKTGFIKSTDFHGHGFVWAAGTITGWTAYRGSGVEEWGVGIEKFVELNNSNVNYGIKQDIKNVKAGRYLLQWQDSGRTNDNVVNESYYVKVYYKDADGLERKIFQSPDFAEISKETWTVRLLSFEITNTNFDKASEAGSLIYIAFIPLGLHTGYGNLIDKIKLLPVNFKTYPDKVAGPDKAHKLDIPPTKQNERQFYGPEWKKFVCKVWDINNTVDLISYLERLPGSHAEYTSVLKWKVDGVIQTSNIFSIESEPGEDTQRKYLIEVLPINGVEAFDRLTITTVPRSTKTKFDIWYTTEIKDLSWLRELVNLFASFDTTPIPPGGGFRRPDRNCKLLLYYEPSTQDTRMHPDSYFESRSYQTLGHHGHQMNFYKDGVLLRTGVSAGSADKSAPFPHWIDHIAMDVTPFVWAIQLDGTPANQNFKTLSAPIITDEGAYFKKYSKCRPTIANSKAILPDGGKP